MPRESSRDIRLSAPKLILLAMALAIVSRAKVKITPATPVVVSVGTTMKFKANVPVTWSLAPGSAGSIDPDGTYHAPASVSVHSSMAGCQILPNDHVMNTRIDSLPVLPNSKTWLSQIPGPISYGPSWGINIADAHTPKHAMHFAYTIQHDGLFEILPWPYLKRESGLFSDPLSELDRHVLTVDRESCEIFELYNNYDAGTQKTCPTCTAQSGVRYASMSGTIPAGATDAAGLLLAPLTLHLEEIRSGAIRHALRVTLQNSKISPSHVWPATAQAGAWGTIPYGTRFRLRRDFDTSRFSPLARVFLTQLKEYGFFVADGGANWEVDGSTDVTEDAAAMNAFGEIGRINPTTDLEAVDESALMASESSGQIKPDNGYVKPDSYVEIIATELKNASSSGRVRIALEGITIGLPDPAIWIQSGVSKKLIAWVNGTSNKALAWSMSPSLGTISPDGVYSAPSVNHPTTTTLTAKSVADPESRATLELTVMPAGPIRIDIGNATGAPGAPHKYAPDYGPDSEGHMWWRDQAGEVSGGGSIDDWNAPWPKIPDIGLYYTSRYSAGDMTYRFLVPNGNYKITLMFAQTDCTGQLLKVWRIPFSLEAQGHLVIRNFDMGQPIDYACRTPVTESIPAEVTDNSLYFSLRRVTFPGWAPTPLINAFSIAPDNNPPHLSVSPHIDAITTGEHKQFNAVGWRMSGSVKWSLTGPGSISPSGVYTAPSSPPASDQNVAIEAQSTANPSISATEKFTFKFGSLALSPASAAVDRGISQRFEAKIGSAAYTSLRWSITPQIGSISADGVYTAPDTLAHNAEVTVNAQSKDNPNNSAHAKVTVYATPRPIRMNCGGAAFNDANGNVWSNDYGFSEGTMAYLNRVPIANAPPDMQYLYQTSRYRYQNDSFSYNFPLPNGRYAVTLKFADYTYDNPGNYIFDVRFNGKEVLTNFDPDRVYGRGKSAVDKQFEVLVTNKSLRIDFVPRKGAAAEINGIQIIYLGPA